MNIKNQVIVLFISFLTLDAYAFSRLSTEVVQDYDKNLNKYYGSEFNQKLSGKINSEELKVILNEVLAEQHSNTNELDVIGDTCQNKVCFKHQPLDYSEARQVVYYELHFDKSKSSSSINDVYCDKEVDLDPQSRRMPDSSDFNIEHTWPKSKFSRKFNEDTQKTDLHHLFPTDSEANAIRSNHPFGDAGTNQDRNLDHSCPISKLAHDGSSFVFEPPKKHKGNVARALFYFSIRYLISINDKEEKILRQWDKLDPIDEAEILRNSKVFSIQKNRNPFVDFPGLADKFVNF